MHGGSANPAARLRAQAALRPTGLPGLGNRPTAHPGRAERRAYTWLSERCPRYPSYDGLGDTALPCDGLPTDPGVLAESCRGGPFFRVPLVGERSGAAVSGREARNARTVGTW